MNHKTMKENQNVLSVSISQTTYEYLYNIYDYRSASSINQEHCFKV